MANQGAGKTLFREFKSNANSIHKSFITGFLKGYGLDADDYDSSMEGALFDLVTSLQELNSPNADLWVSRAQDHIASKRDEMEKKYPGAFNRVQYTDDASKYDDIEPPEAAAEDEQIEEEFEERIVEYIELEGKLYPLLNKDDIAYFRSLGYVRRKTVVPTEGELEQYVNGVPYIVGIEPVYDNGEFEGFVVWIEYN